MPILRTETVSIFRATKQMIRAILIAFFAIARCTSWEIAAGELLYILRMDTRIAVGVCILICGKIMARLQNDIGRFLQQCHIQIQI